MHLHDQDQNNLFCTEYKKEDDNQLFRFNFQDIVKVKSVYKDIFRDHQKQKQITHPYHIYIFRIADPGMSFGVRQNALNLVDSIVHYSLGKRTSLHSILQLL